MRLDGCYAGVRVAGVSILLFVTTVFRLVVGPTQSPIQLVPGGKAAEAWNLPFTSGTEVMNAWSYTATSPYVFMEW
jgi:hypothetical protein